MNSLRDSEPDELRAPPHSDNAEQAVLGGLLLQNGATRVIEGVVSGDDFYVGVHRELFETITTLLTAGSAADVVTVSEVLRSRGRLDQVGGIAYIGALVDNVPTAANIAHYAAIVRKLALQRRIAGVANEFAERAMAPGAADVATLLDDLRERVDGLALEGRTTGRFYFLTFDEVRELRGGQWRIVKVIPGRGVIVIYGAPGSGKTFLAFDILAGIARGGRWYGHRVKRGAVVYLAAEGHLRHRAKAYRLQHPDADLSLLRVVQAPLNLLNPKADLAPLLAQLRALSVELGPIAAVVIDTVNSVMPGGDENASEDMGSVICAARKIGDVLDCTVILVHHTGKSANGPRGFSGLNAAADCQILVTDDNGFRCAEIEKQRDGESGEKLYFRLIPHSWPSEDPDAEDGELEGSCTVEPVLGAVPAAGKTTRRDGALDALREALGEHGELLPETSTIPGGVKAVRLERWRARWLLRTGDDYSKAEVAEAAFRRERKKLIDAGKVAVAHPFVWIV